jgi:hypothetical protein
VQHRSALFSSLARIDGRQKTHEEDLEGLSSSAHLGRWLAHIILSLPSPSATQTNKRAAFC